MNQHRLYTHEDMYKLIDRSLWRLKDTLKDLGLKLEYFFTYYDKDETEINNLHRKFTEVAIYTDRFLNEIEKILCEQKELEEGLHFERMRHE